MKDESLSPEILKLMDKIAKNPASRLFVPLAEEYLKAGMPDEAVFVLVDGIKNHPTYVAARVMLGKIYFQKKQLPEAKAEFEQVIAANPENILARKKLALIYQEEGDLQKAVGACKTILTIDPSDKETKTLIALLEKGIASAPPSELAPDIQNVSAPPDSAEASAPSDLPRPAFYAGEAPVETDQPASPETAQGAADPFVSEALLSSQIPQGGALPPPVPEVSEELPLEPVSSGMEASFEMEDRSFDSSPVAESNGVLFQEKIDSKEEPGLEKAQEGGEALPREADQDDPVMNEIDQLDFGGPVSIPPAPEPSSDLEVATNTLASLYMSQGHYEEAAEVYKKLLMRNPSDEESSKGLEKAIQHLSTFPKPKEAPSESRNNQGKVHSPAGEKKQRLQAWLDSIRKDRGE